MTKRNETAFRFAVRASNGPRSAVWRVWAAAGKSDVYIAARFLAGSFKISIHQSGYNRAAFTSEYVESGFPMTSTTQDRAIDKWVRPPGDHPYFHAFKIIIPSRTLTRPRAGARAETGSITWIEAPTGDSAVVFDVVMTNPNWKLAERWPGEWQGRRMIGSVQLAGGETLWVTAGTEELSEAWWASKEALGAEAYGELDSTDHPRRFRYGFLRNEGTRYFVDLSVPLSQ